MRLSESKIVSRAKLKSLVADHKKNGQTVVFANGCFDIVHVGHVRYLEAARQKGDVLVVAINSDASVRDLKGPGRPILGEAVRAKLVAALRAVDYVVIFNDHYANRSLCHGCSLFCSCVSRRAFRRSLRLVPAPGSLVTSSVP